MPNPNTDAAHTDNVIADGQSIILPTDAPATYVDLLVASTCGTTAFNPAIQLGMNFTENDPGTGLPTYRSANVPSVPDWLNGTPPTGDPTITLAATLDHADAGTTPTTRQPNLYHLKIYTQLPQDHLHSITLPNLGSNFTDVCTTANLHILAITTDQDPPPANQQSRRAN